MIEPIVPAASPEAAASRWVLLVERSLVAVLLGAVIALPLVFVPGWDDGYALPRAVLLRGGGVIATCLFVAYVALGGRLAIRLNAWIDLPLAAFGVLLLLSTAMSVDPGHSFIGEPYQFQGLATVLAYIGLFYLSRLVLGGSERFRMLLVALACGGALVAGYAIAQRTGFDPFWSGRPDNRVISSVGQPNNLAAYLDLVIIAAIGLWDGAGRRGRAALAVLLAGSVAALVLTLSRGGYLGLAVALVVLGVPRVRGISRRRLVAVGVSIATALVIVVGASIATPLARDMAGRVVDRVTSMTDLSDGSVRSHLDLWRLGLAVAVDHPLIGTGPETFPLVVGPYLDIVLEPARVDYLSNYRLESPHNQLIGIAAEMGLAAVAAWVAFLAGCARACLRGARRRDVRTASIAVTTLAVLATHVTTTWFMTPETATSAVFLVVLGAGVATSLQGQPRSRCGLRASN